jgi:hypothetical protein
MRGSPRVLAWVVIAVTWCVGSASAAAWGLRLGWVHGPTPGGCGCFNPGTLLFAGVWGVVGAISGVVVWSALFGMLGLAVFLRRGRPSAGESPRESPGKPAVKSLPAKPQHVEDLVFGERSAGLPAAGSEPVS